MADGVVALLIGSNGTVWASVSDFDTSGYGGFTLAEAQEIRAKRSLAFKYLEGIAHPHLVSAVNPMEAERIMRAVCDKHGHKVVVKVIGHDDNKED